MFREHLLCISPCAGLQKYRSDSQWSGGDEGVSLLSSFLLLTVCLERPFPSRGMVNTWPPPTACQLGVLSHCHSQKGHLFPWTHTLFHTRSGQSVGWASLSLFKNLCPWEDSHTDRCV